MVRLFRAWWHYTTWVSYGFRFYCADDLLTESGQESRFYSFHTVHSPVRVSSIYFACFLRLWRRLKQHFRSLSWINVWIVLGLFSTYSATQWLVFGCRMCVHVCVRWVWKMWAPKPFSILFFNHFSHVVGPDSFLSSGGIDHWQAPRFTSPSECISAETVEHLKVASRENMALTIQLQDDSLLDYGWKTRPKW